MFSIIDCSSWNVWEEGMTEGSGRSEKEWLVSDNEHICLFKYPKSSKTTEHVSEHLACQIGRIIDIETANIDLGFRDGRLGSISYRLNTETQDLLEGIWFICRPYPKYNADKLIDEASRLYYSLEMIETSLDVLFNQEVMAEMILFDFLIGNSDRHQSNWAILAETVEMKPDPSWPCPLYDNGSSLCSYVTDAQINHINHNDKNALLALTDTKSRSCIRINGNDHRQPTHKEMVRHILERYGCALGIAHRILDKMTKATIIDLLSQYPTNVLPEERNALIRMFLEKKVEILYELVREAGGR